MVIEEKSNINIQRPKLSAESFSFMKLLANRCGINLSDYRKDAIYNRLVRRLRLLGISDFDDYCHKLRFDLEEESIFINLITNNTTFFFRENHHFEYFAHKLLPELIAKKSKIRIWSSACSTGEEAYSIAMAVREVIPDLHKYDIKILATDINSDALTTAENGIYGMSHMDQISLERKNTWFNQVSDRGENLFQVSDSLRELISFERLNLVDAFPFHGPIDVIFCRNVLIYFNSGIRNQLLEKFNKIIPANGVLILGHSENLGKQRDLYETQGKTIYRKIS